MSEFANGNDFNASSSGVGAYIVESPTQVSPIDTMIKLATFRENFELKKAIQQQKEAEKQKAFVNKLATFDTKGLQPQHQDYITRRRNEIIDYAAELTNKHGVGADISTPLQYKVNELTGDINALKTRNAEATKNYNDAIKAMAEGKIRIDGDKTRAAYNDWYSLSPEQQIATPPPTMVLNTKTISDYVNEKGKLIKPKTKLTVNPDGTTVTEKGASDEELAVWTKDISSDPQAQELMMSQFNSFPEDVKKAYVHRAKNPETNPFGLEPWEMKTNSDFQIKHGLQVTDIGETPAKKGQRSISVFKAKEDIKTASKMAGLELAEMEKVLGGGTSNWILDNSSPVGEKIMVLPNVVMKGNNNDVFAVPKVGLVEEVINGKKVAIYKVYSTAPLDEKDTEKEGKYYVHRTANPTEILGLLQIEHPQLFKDKNSYPITYNYFNKNYGSANEGEEPGLNRLINKIGKNAQLEKRTKPKPIRGTWKSEEMDYKVGVKGAAPTKKKTETKKNQLTKTLSSGRIVYSDDNGKTWHP